MSQPQGVQRRLRLLRPNNQKIKQNLKPLVENTKKKLAQSIYYENHPENQSPLIRAEKRPVHQRLGLKQIRLRRLVPLGTSTASILPKRKFLKFPNKVENSFKQHKLHRYYSAQARLERIRTQQHNHNVIKLRRFNGSANNLMVEVKNPNFVPDNNSPIFGGFYKFKMILNPQIQAEIVEIQKDSVGLVSPLPPLTRITPVTTTMGISERFTLL